LRRELHIYFKEFVGCVKPEPPKFLLTGPSGDRMIQTGP
jgi:hypothetical protein